MNGMKALSTKESILNCAANLMQERGYHGWSYNDIAQQVGLKKATLHYYFPKKELLVKELIQNYRKNTMRLLHASKDLSPQEQLLAVIDLFASVLDDPNLFCLCGMLAADYPTLSKELVEELTHYFNDFEKHIQTIFEKGEKESLWTCHQSSLFEARSLISTFEGMLLMSRLRGGKEGFQQMARNYVSKWIQ